jgi:ATP-dependent protease ClpP protease subunit
MTSWNELLAEVDELPDDTEKAEWLIKRQQQALQDISTKRSGRNVIFYASAFLQKPKGSVQISPEDINGFMSVMYGMDWGKNLTLLLHTPGGAPTAVETIVDYLHSKFADIEVIIPTYAMSAGTMLSLAADRIIMGRQSQLGPIDPQMLVGGRFVSARSIVAQFEQARSEILRNLNLAHAWAPILQSIGPALLQEAQNALDYGELMVAKWLEQKMFRSIPRPAGVAKKTAAHFNKAEAHKSHGRRISRDEARLHHIMVEDLENDNDLQDHVLTAYHMITIAFERTPATKLLVSNHNRMWVKNA